MIHLIFYHTQKKFATGNCENFDKGFPASYIIIEMNEIRHFPQGAFLSAEGSAGLPASHP
jgi:hypothetical protein